MALLLAACSSEKAPDPVAAAAPDDRIECAPAGAADFGRDCSVERQGAELVIHHRDGGFRRLRVGDGGFSAADGAQPLTTRTLPGDLVEIDLGGDRYRLPKAIGDALAPAR